MNKIPNFTKNYPLLMLILAAGGLAIAFIVEYLMHLEACPLCIYQRFPYLVIIALAVYDLQRQKFTIYSYLGLFALSIFIASYHSGVERGVFELSSLCRPLITIHSGISASDFVNMLGDASSATCDKPALVVLSLSMTEWNLLFNLFLFTISLYVNFRLKKLL